MFPVVVGFSGGKPDFRCNGRSFPPLLLAATRPPILPETSHGMEGVKKLARSQSIKLCEKLKIPVPGRERSSSRESNRVNNEGEEEEDSSTPTKLPILRSFHSVSKQISEKKQTNGNY